MKWFIPELTALVTLIFSLSKISLWIERRKQRQRNENKESSRKNRHSERYSNIQDSDERVIAARLHAIVNKLQAQYEQQHTHEQGEKWRESITISVLIVTFLAAVASAVFLYFQLIDARRAVEVQHLDSQASSDVSQRAWIGITEAILTPFPPAVGRPVHVKAFYVNSGKEPATKFVKHMEFAHYAKKSWISGEQDPPIIELASKCLSVTNDSDTEIVFPNVASNGASVNLDTYVNFRGGRVGYLVSPDLILGKEVIVFTGCFTYYSIRSYHHTAFCVYYDAARSDPSHLLICEHGNAAN